MHYSAGKKCISGRSLKDCFYCCSWQIKSAGANKSLIPYDLIKRPPETKNLEYRNTECQNN